MPLLNTTLIHKTTSAFASRTPDDGEPSAATTRKNAKKTREKNAGISDGALGRNNQMADEAKWAPETPSIRKENLGKSVVGSEVSAVHVLIEAARGVSTASPMICGLVRLVHPGRAAQQCGLMDGIKLSVGEYGFATRTVKAKVDAHELEMAQVQPRQFPR